MKKEFGVTPEDVDSCYDIFIKNIDELNLKEEIKGNVYLKLDKLGEQIGDVQETELETPDENVHEKIEGGYNYSQLPEQKLRPKQICVAHGKNTKPLDQLKTILDEFEVPYLVAIDEANQGRPISNKVSDLMHECSSAIFIFTKDEETKDVDGNIIYRPSGNVVYELGAASVLYGKKIVIFKENEVSFGSDFKDLGYISFETDKLDAKTIDLMKELVGFGLLKVSAA